MSERFLDNYPPPAAIFFREPCTIKLPDDLTKKHRSSRKVIKNICSDSMFFGYLLKHFTQSSISGSILEISLHIINMLQKEIPKFRVYVASSKCFNVFVDVIAE